MHYELKMQLLHLTIDKGAKVALLYSKGGAI